MTNDINKDTLEISNKNKARKLKEETRLNVLNSHEENLMLSYLDDLRHDDNLDDKQKIMSLLEKHHQFYCDTSDKNLTVYFWNGKLWDDNVEQIILKRLSELFKNKKINVTYKEIIDCIKGRYQLTLEKKPSYLVACNNGFIDINKDELIPHDPKYFYVNISPHNYVKSDCPIWDKILNNIHKKEDLAFIQEWWGYNLYTAYPVKAFLICVGSGDNGKTIELEVVKNIIGRKNNTSVTLQYINNNPYGVAELKDKLCNISDDISNQKIRYDGILKTISDGGEVTARRIYGHPFDLIPITKITNACNIPPEILDGSDAIWNRLKFIIFPFYFCDNPIKANEKKKEYEKEELLSLLEKEAEGIFYWMVQGLIRLKKNKFKFSYNLSTKEVRDYYRIKSNPIASFINDEIIDTGNEVDDIIYKPEMIKYIKEYLENNNLDINISDNTIYKELNNLGIKDSRPGSLDRVRVYAGYKYTPSKHPSIITIKHIQNFDNNIERNVNVSPRTVGQKQLNEIEGISYQEIQDKLDKKG